MEAFVRSLPKAELHLHLEGSIRPAVALGLARRHGVALPGADGGETGVAAAFACRDFSQFIPIYLALSRCLQTERDLVEVTADLARRLVSDNVRYAEVTFTPLTHLRRGVPAPVLVAGLQQARAAARDLGVEMRWVFDIVRCFPDQAVPTLEFAQAVNRRDPGAGAGLGLSGPEAGDYPLDALPEVFACGRAEGLHTLPHAGESLGAASVAAAVDRLGAERIGHGVRCLEDAQVVARLCDRGIALEVCPTSNVTLGVVADLAAHPLPQLLAAGLQVSLATDDPGIFGVGLVQEFVGCAQAFEWTRATVAELVAASWRHAFVDEATRAHRLGEISRLIAEDPSPSTSASGRV